MSNIWKKYWSIIITALIVIILVGIGNSKTSFLGLTLKPGQKEAQKAIDFINKNMLQGQTATLESVKDVSGVYQFKLKIGDQEYDSYVTKDGKILFTSGVDISPATTTTTSTTQPSAQAQQPKQTCSDLAKTNSPVLEAFVVSKCPFGLQMQRVLAEVVKTIPSLASNIKVEYIGSITNGKLQSMHDSQPGGEEATENMRQICIREQQPTKYWDYVVCHIQKGDVDTCLSQAKVDTAKLTSCLTDPNQGLAYAKEDIARMNKFGVTGSPTLVLNDKEVSEFDFGGRTANALKTILCCGFTNEPSFCTQNINSDQAATGFSETYSTSSGNTSSGNCN
jgi:hypothetical protein